MDLLKQLLAMLFGGSNNQIMTDQNMAFLTEMLNGGFDEQKVVEYISQLAGGDQKNLNNVLDTVLKNLSQEGNTDGMDIVQQVMGMLTNRK